MGKDVNRDPSGALRPKDHGSEKIPPYPFGKGGQGGWIKGNKSPDFIFGVGDIANRFS